MGRTFRIVALGIALTAFAVLAFLGFAIWVFIPLLPAGIVFFIAVATARERATKPAQPVEDETKSRKAA